MVSQVERQSLTLESSLPYCLEGLVQVFTSGHRSFFTNVMAQSLTIAGQGTPVLVVQFLKGGINMGPEHPMRLGQNLDWLRCNLPRCIDTPHLEPEELQALRDLWDHTCSMIQQRKYALVVLDELSLAIDLGLIPEGEVLALLEQRPKSIDLILTGPKMPQSILDRADQVTEFRRSLRPSA
jgi:cob(I)alamin adenosyltransferase